MTLGFYNFVGVGGFHKIFLRIFFLCMSMLNAQEPAVRNLFSSVT